MTEIKVPEYIVLPGGHFPVPAYMRTHKYTKSLEGKRADRIRFDPAV